MGFNKKYSSPFFANNCGSKARLILLLSQLKPASFLWCLQNKALQAFFGVSRAKHCKAKRDRQSLASGILIPSVSKFLYINLNPF